MCSQNTDILQRYSYILLQYRKGIMLDSSMKHSLRNYGLETATDRLLVMLLMSILLAISGKEYIHPQIATLAELFSAGFTVQLEMRESYAVTGEWASVERYAFPTESLTPIVMKAVVQQNGFYHFQVKSRYPDISEKWFSSRLVVSNSEVPFRVVYTSCGQKLKTVDYTEKYLAPEYTRTLCREKTNE